ncbi:T-complex protein 1 subunit gamma [Octopus bimaculoides]|uniref:T-complex protein 1 subunit gamma n=1 Tax=Octopus bimaculoides TaxID=37653 RepID=UPI0022E3527F|nr:T-complex protein 1 subunit gamma [Octopus bimaculoides]
MFGGSSPIIVLNQNTKRESGHKVQFGNIKAGKSIADIIQTCLGPRSMLKMLMDPMGGIVMTNDGNAILREITVQHPAAKSIIEVARTQDEEVGDGTTSVIVLTGEVLNVASPFLGEQMHPTVIISAFRRALDDILEIMKAKIGVPVDVNNDAELLKIIKSCIGTKFMKQWSELACKMALTATKIVLVEEKGKKEIDIKNFAKVEKIPGGCIEDSCVLQGILLNKDVTHPKMKRKIENPRILLLDCSLEYKKGESQTNIEITAEDDFANLSTLGLNELMRIFGKLTWKVQTGQPFFDNLFPSHEFSRVLGSACLLIKLSSIDRPPPHSLMLAFISLGLLVHLSFPMTLFILDILHFANTIRFCSSPFSVSFHISLFSFCYNRASGATIVSRTEEIKEEDVGTACGLFEIKKIGDEYFTYLIDCKNPKACTMVLRGASKDILNEVDRNLQDALNVTRNVIQEPVLVPGGGATEMALAHALNEKAKSIVTVHQWPYRAIAKALEIIPSTLIQNCGASTIRTLTALRAKHAQPNSTSWGIDGETGEVVDMKQYGIWEPCAVRAQTFKTAIETAILLLRIDDIVSGVKKAESKGGASRPPPPDAQPNE